MNISGKKEGKQEKKANIYFNDRQTNNHVKVFYVS